MNTHRNTFKLMETWFGYFQGNVPIAAIPSQIVSTPSLNLGTSSSGSPGTEQTFTVEGTNLQTDIVVTGTTNVEVSLTSGAGFTSSVAVSPSGGTVTATTIYARTKSTAPVGAVAETLAVASGGAPGYGVDCTGTVSSGPSFPSGALAIWDFEDTLVSTPGSYTLTASGGNSYVAGKVNTNALQLTATNTASITSDVFNFAATAFTLSFWTKRATGGSPRIFYTNGNTAWDLDIDLTTSGDVTFRADADGADVRAVDTYTVADDTWTYLCVRFDGSAISLNVNARTKVTASVASVGDTPGGLMSVSANLATCAFDQVTFDDRAWTDQEVSNVYNGGTGLSS